MAKRKDTLVQRRQHAKLDCIIGRVIIGARSDEYGAGIDIELSMSDDVANDMIWSLCDWYGVSRHKELISQLLQAPATLDRMAAEREAAKIMGEV